jgi:hypothetical protein
MKLSFIFKLNNNPTVYYGKIIFKYFINSIPLEYQLHIDFDTKNIIRIALNTYLKSIGMPKLRSLSVGMIGIIKNEDYLETENSEEQDGIFNLYIKYDVSDREQCYYSCNNINDGVIKTNVPF